MCKCCSGCHGKFRLAVCGTSLSSSSADRDSDDRNEDDDEIIEQDGVIEEYFAVDYGLANQNVLHSCLKFVFSNVIVHWPIFLYLFKTKVGTVCSSTFLLHSSFCSS